MIYSLSGKVAKKYDDFAVIEVAGIGFKIFFPKGALKNLPQNEEIEIFTHLHWKQDGPDLYGFSNEAELHLFEKLISVSSVGPKSAMSILSIAKIDQVIAAINQGQENLLIRASGIGKKTAERIILELKGKLILPKEKTAETISLLESDLEIEETLIALGYKRQQAKEVISKIEPKLTAFKDRLKDALKKARQAG